MNYQPDADCMRAAREAAGSKISEADILSAFQAIADHKQRLIDAGQITGMEARLRKFAETRAEQTKIAAAMQRRHAAINVIIHDKQMENLEGMITAGLSAKEAMLAIVEGRQEGVANARKSMYAQKEARRALYTGGLMSAIERDKPHLIGMLDDEKLDADVLAEMMELKPNGKVGKTGNSDAVWLAKTFSDVAELARVDLNRLGASIGKLDGWAGPQMHDDLKLIAAGKDPWVTFIRDKLDFTRTFSEGYDPTQVTDMLGDIYDTIITGMPNKPTAASQGLRVNPANLAKSLGASRVLHFKDAKAALEYRDEFGHGNTITGMLAHLDRSAHLAANMETLGPNPQIMFNGLADELKRKIKADAKLSPQEKADQIASLDTEVGALRTSMDIASGLATRPESVKWAQRMSTVRALASVSKLGGAVITSIPSDTASVAMAAMFRGNNVLAETFKQFAGVMKGRPKGEAAEIAYLYNAGWQGLLGHITNPNAAVDGVRGITARTQTAFFKWNGLTRWTDVSRSVAATSIGAEMGMRVAKSFADLHPRYSHVLSMNGIDAKKWEALRSVPLRNVDGNNYLTPDMIAQMPDRAVEPLVQKQLDAARKSAKDDADYAARAADIIYQGKRELQLDVLRFVTDETNYAVIQTDSKTQRFTTLNKTLRPGSFAGEAVRLVMQFKSFPIAFTERVWGRMLYGQRKGIGKSEHLMHVGSLLAMTTIAGYMAMVAKDAIKGYWPPRDPADPRTWIAAFQQGGAVGIYGDFLFSKTSRTGGGLAEALAGPTLGMAGDLYDAGMDARDAAISGGDDQFSGARAFSTATAAIPFGNVFYVKPVLDYLWLNSMREALSPGYLRRQETTRQKEYGQSSFIPRTMSR